MLIQLSDKSYVTAVVTSHPPYLALDLCIGITITRGPRRGTTRGLQVPVVPQRQNELGAQSVADDRGVVSWHGSVGLCDAGGELLLIGGGNLAAHATHRLRRGGEEVMCDVCRVL